MPAFDADRGRPNMQQAESNVASDAVAGNGGKRAKKSAKGTGTDASFARAIARIWARAGKMTKKERLAAADAVYGSWKDRPEWKGMTTLEIAAQLRRRALGRDRNG